MNRNEVNRVLALIRREVVPAIGCTEPAAVALAVARAREVLRENVIRSEVWLSANMLKNAMGVGIPGTGMIGLPIAIALGMVTGKSDDGLEVLKELDEVSLEKAKRLVEGDQVSVHLKDPAPDKLYIEAYCHSSDSFSKVIICGAHTNICYIARGNEVLLNTLGAAERQQACEESPELTFGKVYDFATQTPAEAMAFILKAAELNKKAAAESRKGDFGHSVARVLDSGIHKNILGDSLFTRIIAQTASACDVRMAGAMVPVMSNSGSGNQGITATLPVVVFAEETGKSREELIRALMLSHLMSIYIKQHLGRLSGLCGVIVAAIGASCGITYLMGGSREQISSSVKNMIGNITGVICDGAKPSCAMKVSSAVSTAVISSMMAIENKVISSLEGIADDDVDQTIRNLTDIGSEGMIRTDRMVLDIMTRKK